MGKRKLLNIPKYYFDKISNLIKNKNKKDLKVDSLEELKVNLNKLQKLLGKFNDKNGKKIRFYVEKKGIDIITLKKRLNNQLEKNYNHISINDIQLMVDFTNNLDIKKLKDSNIISYLYYIIIENNIDIETIKKELKISKDLSLYYFLNKIKHIDINKNNNFYFINNSRAKGVNVRNIETQYILNLINSHKSKNLKINILNLFNNYKPKLSIEEIYDKVVLYDNNISKEIIEKELRGKEEFKLINIKKWSLTSSNYETFGEDLVKDFKNVLDYKKNKRNINIILERILTERSLESIGNDYNLTRERIRQIEKKIKRKIVHQTNYKNIKPYIQLIENCFGKELIINKNKMNNIRKHYFKALNFKEILNFYEFLTSKKIFIINNKLLSYKDKDYYINSLESIFNNHYGSMNINQIIKMLNDNIEKDILIKLIEILDNFYYYNDKIYFARTKSEMTDIIIRDFYPEGVYILDEIEVIKSLLNKIFLLSSDEFTDRITSYFERKSSDVIIWDKGKFIHLDNIDIPKNDLINIKEYILEELKNHQELRIKKPFEKYKHYLLSLDIKNKYALYFLMKELFNKELYFFRFPRILPNSKKDLNVKDNSELLNEFVIENGKIIDKDSLSDHFMNEFCWSKEDIANNISINKNLVELNNNKIKYTNNKKQVTKKQSDYIKEVALNELEKNDDIYINLDDNFIKELDANQDITIILNVLGNSKMFLVLGHKNNMKIILLKENKYDINTNVDFITYIISKHFGGIVDSSLLNDYLSKIGFVDEELPNYYKSNKDEFPFIYFDQTFVIK